MLVLFHRCTDFSQSVTDVCVEKQWTTFLGFTGVCFSYVQTFCTVYYKFHFTMFGNSHSFLLLMIPLNCTAALHKFVSLTCS